MMKFCFKLSFLACSLFPGLLSAQLQFDPVSLLDPKQNGEEIASQLKTVEIYEYSDTLQNCIYLKNGLRSSQFVNEAQWLELQDSVEVYRIDVVYSKYPLKKGVYNEIYPLLFNRLNSLFEMDPSLNNTRIEWNKVLQTHCVSDEQVSKLFHGVVIWYRIPKRTEPVSAKSKAITASLSEKEAEQNSIEELQVSVEKIKSMSFVNDSLRKVLNKQPLDEQSQTIVQFLEKEIDKNSRTVSQDASKDEIELYEKQLKEFMNRFKSNDNVVEAVFKRHPEWKNMLVVTDWTGSMYGYGAQVLQWHILNIEKSGLMSLTLFNDGDTKKQSEKEIGRTGGIYSGKAAELEKLINLFNLVMLKGGGGDGPENDIEALLEAMELFPLYGEIVLIADNNACIRDIRLADRIGKPVKVIVCGYNPDFGINPDLAYLAKITRGSIHTIEDDMENIEVTLGEAGEIKTYNDKRFKLTGKKCGSYSIVERDVINDFKSARFHKRRTEKLNISNTGLNSVPKQVFKMRNLSYLDLSHNKLTAISSEIENLVLLKDLNLSYNKLTQLPAALENIDYIQTIDLSHNELETVPKPLLNMKYLVTLNLSFNQLKIIDKTLYIRRLEHLDLSSNQINDCKRVLGYLVNLKTLDLSDNALAEVPYNIVKLKFLETLDLSNNQLKKLPAQLEGLKSLKTLHLQGNQFDESEINRIRTELPTTNVSF